MTSAATHGRRNNSSDINIGLVRTTISQPKGNCALPRSSLLSFDGFEPGRGSSIQAFARVREQNQPQNEVPSRGNRKSKFHGQHDIGRLLGEWIRMDGCQI